MMQLVGAVCLTMVVFVLPVVFSFKIWGNRMTIWQKIYGVVIVACGATAGAYASVSTVSSIVSKLKAGDTQ